MDIVKCRETIDVPIDLVWMVISDFGSILSWLSPDPQVRNGSIICRGQGVGMVRKLRLPKIGEVHHRLEASESERYFLSYSLVFGNPLGMNAYIASLRLERFGEQCKLHWKGEFKAQNPEEVKKISSGLIQSYKAMSKGLENLLGSCP